MLETKSTEALRKLPKDIAKRLIQKIEAAKENPKHFLESLAGDPGYKIRAGDYRIIVDIVEEQKILAVRIVGHRQNIYKRHLNTRNSTGL